MLSAAIRISVLSFRVIVETSSIKIPLMVLCYTSGVFWVNKLILLHLSEILVEVWQCLQALVELVETVALVRRVDGILR